MNYTPKQIIKNIDSLNAELDTIYMKAIPSKTESEKEIVNAHLKGIRDSNIKGMIQGLELTAKMICGYIEKGNKLEDVKVFCEKLQTQEGRNALMKYLSVDKDEEEVK